MAKNTFQYKSTISVNRDNFIEVVVLNRNLKKKDYRVLLQLLTHLDSMTYKDISKKNIADMLDMSKSDVSDAIETLVYENIIEKGSSASVSGGYRLLF
jgi:predicted transcriptional regulator